MLERLVVRRKCRASALRPFVRLHLEQLEKREVLDASLVQSLSFLALTSYQTAKQIQQDQATTQTALAKFSSDSTSYTTGQGVTFTQINQDISTLQQNASNIQALNSKFQTYTQFFVYGLMQHVGSFSSDDSGPLLVDTYLLMKGQSLVTPALQTASQASSATPPTMTMTAASTTGGSQQLTFTAPPQQTNLDGVSLQTNQFQFSLSLPPGSGNLMDDLNEFVSAIKSEVASLVQNIHQNLTSSQTNTSSSSNPPAS